MFVRGQQPWFLMETTIGPWKISIERHWPSAAQLAARYDDVAASWHTRIKRRGYLDAYRSLFGTLYQRGVFAAVPSGGTVLDVGVGTGAFSLALMQTVRRQLHLFGIDISEQMVMTAKETFRTHQILAQIGEGNAIALAYPDESFDIVTSAHLLEHLPAPQAGLVEMARVLKPGAPLILSVTRPGFFGRWLQVRWHNGVLAPDEITDLLRESGFTDLEVVAYGQGWAHWTSLVYVAYKA